MINDALEAQHAQNVNAFQRLTSAQGHIADMQQALQRLAPLGANVTRNDVMEQVMQLVDSGRLSSKEAAIALGQMPLQGPALAEWISGHIQRYSAMEQQLGQMHEQARQAMVGTAIQGLARAMGSTAPPSQAAPAPAPANVLASPARGLTNA